MPVKRKAAARRGHDGAARSGEFRWIDSIRRRQPRLAAGTFPVGIGDDAAVWRLPRGHCAVLTVDAQVEGTHFRRDWLSLREIGARAAEAGLSDIAAMAARARGLLVSLALPAGTTDAELFELYAGIEAASRRAGAPIVGGNLSSGPLSITITALGSGVPSRLVRRNGARPGDRLWVTGEPGLARLGLLALQSGRAAAPPPPAAADRRALARGLAAFRAPRARLQAALRLARAAPLRAMLDVSDGLAADLGHLIEESAAALGAPLGAELDGQALAAGADRTRLAALVRAPLLETILAGGEDYELLFATRPSPHALAALRDAARALRLRLTLIGRIVERPGVRVLGDGGTMRTANMRGWDHFRR